MLLGSSWHTFAHRLMIMHAQNPVRNSLPQTDQGQFLKLGCKTDSQPFATSRHFSWLSVTPRHLSIIFVTLTNTPKTSSNMHVFLRHISSHLFLARHIISYVPTSRHITYYLMISHHVSSHHIISRHILSYHVISRHIMSYHDISELIEKTHRTIYHTISSYHDIW